MGERQEERYRCHLPAVHGKTQLAHGMEESCSLLQKGRHFRTLIDRALHRQEAAIQLVNHTHIHHIAEENQDVTLLSS